ncbi:MAG: hypothetical protein HAW66_01530 [Shewanella sp.]|nr:hypothetical protein [Shewanella sp.]
MTKISLLKPVLLLSLLAASANVIAGEANYYLDLSWDSKYMAKGKPLLSKGGAFWGEVGVDIGDFSAFVAVGEGEQLDFKEYDIGLDYRIISTEDWTVELGYLGIDCSGLAEYNFQSHYFDVDVSYTALPWLTPSVQAIYRTNGGGYYIETELRGHWTLLIN